MRYILISSILLGLPLAAVAQEEPQTTQTQYGQEQAQDTQTQQQQQDRQSQQQGQQQQAGMQAGTEPEIARAQFTSEVQNREPVDEVSDFQAQREPLYFFTEVKNAAGETITHRWMHNGEVMAEVPLEIGSDSWRTWSSKEFVPGWDGEWTVEVVDAQGNTLEEASITVETRQMQNVGYSPDQQPQQNQGQTQDQQSPPQSQGQDGAGSMQTEPIEYPPQSTQQSGQQDQDTQAQDMQTQDDQSPIDYEPPTEDTESQSDMQSDTQMQDDEQDSVGQDY